MKGSSVWVHPQRGDGDAAFVQRPQVRAGRGGLDAPLEGDPEIGIVAPVPPRLDAHELLVTLALRGTDRPSTASGARSGKFTLMTMPAGMPSASTVRTTPGP